MSLSRQEEIISLLWLIAALLAFNGGYIVTGWVLVTKSGLDCIVSIFYAVKELRSTKQQKS